MEDSKTVLEGLLAFVWAPLLLLAGLLDWTCHRWQRIEFSASLRESLLHLLMLGQLGTALLAALFLEPTAGLFLVLLLVIALHELSYLVDLRVALAYRPIPVVEQWVHGFQHLLPWVGIGALMALSPAGTLALLNPFDADTDWSLRIRSPPLPWIFTSTLLGAALLLNVIPFLHEAWRCAKVWTGSRS